MKIRLLFVLVSIAALPVLHAEERMRAGLWEVSTTVDGQPSGMNGGTCYTPAMVHTANTPSASLKAATEKSMAARHCIVTDFKMEGNTVAMKTVCGARTSITTSSYGVDSFETTSTATIGAATIVTKMTGRRLGDCK